MEFHGFEVLNIELCWNDEYIRVEGKPKVNHLPSTFPPQAEIKKLELMIDGFISEFEEIMIVNEEKINTIRSEKKRIIAWGAGARGVSFFNLFNLSEEVPYIVDINIKRQNKYLPGSGQKWI